MTDPCSMRFVPSVVKNAKYLLSQQKTGQCTAGNATDRDQDSNEFYELDN